MLPFIQNSTLRVCRSCAEWIANLKEGYRTALYMETKIVPIIRDVYRCQSHVDWEISPIIKKKRLTLQPSKLPSFPPQGNIINWL